MAVATKYVTLELIPETCCNCGIVFGMPDGLLEQRVKDGKSFWCPVGHGMSYTKKETLEQELEATRDTLARQRNATALARAAEDAERRRHAATKGHLTRTKRRANGGVCLDCKRYFKQVDQHRAKMHPEATP
jgi:hypothetical protein